MASVKFDIKLDEKAFAEETGLRFRGLSVGECDEGWRVTIRAWDSDHVGVYCMGVGLSAEEVFLQLMMLVSGREGKYAWRFDKWANINEK